jgi:ppGpp synthetase/RelA/SpoT-type nucleotidyltranferase
MERNTAFLVKVEDLVREIAIQNNIPYYRIESRMEHDAAANTFLPIIRVITYFEDTVTDLSAILHAEFDVEEVKGAEAKKVQVEGYSSKHIEYKLALKANRLDLAEYKRYGNGKFEIQVCSILQDAWSGIGKELGYDGASIPDEARRDLYRVGALLEMADIEFFKIRTLLNKMPVVKLAEVKQPEPIQAAKAPVAPPQAVQAAPPAPKAEAPVATPPPAPKTEAPVAAPAKEQPKPAANIVPLAPKPVKAASPVSVSSIVPQRAMPKQAGIVPKAVNVEKAAVVLSTFDMSVDRSKLDVNVNNVENTNGIAHDKLADVINMAPNDQPVALTQEPIEEPIAAAPEKQPEVSLNIDNIETFNMNVNGLVEKPVEEIKESTLPFLDEKPKGPPPPLDENAQMSDASLKEYVLNSKLLREIDSQISARAGAKLNDEIDIEGDVERLRFLKVFSLKQLHERLADNKNDIIAFAEKWIGKDNGGSFDMGISLFYLEYLLVGKKNDPGFAVEYLLKFISDNDYSARYIIPTYNSIRQTDSNISKFSHLTFK